jgi:AcrR family transcriptional regulator
MTRSVKGLKDSLAKTAKTAKAVADDGRSTRWSAHRTARREELVAAAVEAIDRLGPLASIEDIAASSGVSKPVLYRYFSDKADLHAAVGAYGAALVLERLMPALEADGSLRERVELATTAYLATIEEHAGVFMLLVQHPVAADGSKDADPLADGKNAIAAAIARVLGDALRAFGVDAAGAEPWAHGLVGLGVSTGEWWLTRRTMTRAAVSTYLSSFVWHAFEGIANSYGVRFDEADGELRLVAPEVGDGRHA